MPVLNPEKKKKQIKELHGENIFLGLLQMSVRRRKYSRDKKKSILFLVRC